MAGKEVLLGGVRTKWTKLDKGINDFGSGYASERVSFWKSGSIVTDYKNVLITRAALLQRTNHIHGYAPERGTNNR